ncbi:retrovirus-related pol polyprotein from transposon TNT 1-94 [Tanacetum coccineum]
MTTLAEHMIVVGAENRPPMLDKSMYNSWQSRMLLYIKGKKNGRMTLESIENGPLVYPTIEEDGKIHEKKYKGFKMTVMFKQLTLFFKVSHQMCIPLSTIVRQLKISGIESSYSCKALNCHIKNVNVNDTMSLTNLLQSRFPQLDSGLAIPSFLSGDDPIACLNKAMAFMSTIMASRFPSTNNQLKTSSNPRNQATIQDGRVTIQQVQGRQGQSLVGTGNKGNATSSEGNNVAGQARVVKCYNCQGEGHMARQCTKPKRARNSAWFKEKMLLVQA